MSLEILVILWSVLLVTGQKWYTATLVESDVSIKKAPKPNKIRDSGGNNYTPVQLLHPNFRNKSFSNFVQANKLNLIIPEPTETATKYIDVTTPSLGIPPQNYFTKNQANGSTIYHKKLQGVILVNNTLMNVNTMRPRPKRKIVMRCPTWKPRQNLLERKAKFLDIFHVVQFQNVACTSSDGLDGVCVHQYECATSGGLARGQCADGYGICCVSAFSCGDQTSAQSGWFTNSGFPQPSNERLSCSISLEINSGDIKQIRLDLMTFELLPPTSGSCEQDQFIVSGQKVNNYIPILCGINSGQHLYIEVGDATSIIDMTVQTITEDRRLFAIKFTQLTAASQLAAPTNCLQYYSEREGDLESFNFRELSTTEIPTLPSYLNNLNYAMCIKRADDSCSVTYTNSGDMQIFNYDSDGYPLIPLDQAGIEIFNCPNDWLLISAARFCGDRLNDGSLFQDFSMDAPITDNSQGPIVVWFRSDGAHVGRGFNIHYTQNQCLNTS